LGGAKLCDGGVKVSEFWHGLIKCGATWGVKHLNLKYQTF